ncbi:Os03g0669900 [Oryza sativa Japonica Group]|uniref:Os03g0669900 protein n=1 Tax=Oryza sativa subsp. japonica TaxID=39947 RepID=A0A0P0W1I3_ORYSJ|nr:hypothetical protein EE612_019553 [Oryza sativa]BAS85674.1 Os03g0669900 [Oryza sativa Japonica Group]
MASERAGSKRAAKGTEGTTAAAAAAAALQLHGDVLGEVLRRLAPRWLAACRCVCKAWRDAIDGGGLLRADLLPLSLAGFFLNFSCHDYSEYFSRPTTTTTTTTTTCHRHLITGKLDFLPSEGEWQMALDHCNGLLLLESGCVVNPATKAWMDLTPYPPPPPLIEEEQEVKTYPEEHLVFDPTLSPHFEVLIIPHLLPFDKDRSKKQPPQNSAWPPSPLVLNVFSSRTREWEERPFVREGEAAGAMADVASVRGTHYAAYWRGTLYVRCQSNFVMRFSLSDDKYQVIKMPTVRSNGHSHFCLGRSEKGVYLALITKPRSLQVWVLNESCDEMEWVPKHENNLDSVFPRQTRRRWMLLQDLDKKDSTTFRKEHDEEIDFEWSSDGDDDSDHRGNVPEYRLPATIFQGYHGNVDNNALGFGNFPQPPIPMFYHGYHGNIDVLGFHPYKEIVFLCEAMQTGLAYHLKTSKMEILGKLPLVSSCEEILSNKSFTGVSLPYTPCWM